MQVKKSGEVAWIKVWRSTGRQEAHQAAVYHGREEPDGRAALGDSLCSPCRIHFVCARGVPHIAAVHARVLLVAPFIIQRAAECDDGGRGKVLAAGL